jgi:hypothetical protein
MGEFGQASGFVADVEHPIFGEHPRLAPLVSFSRSATVARPGCLLGQHTDSVLRAIGYRDERIAELRKATDRRLIGGDGAAAVSGQPSLLVAPGAAPVEFVEVERDERRVDAQHDDPSRS